MIIINYCVKQHINIYIGEILPESGYGSLTDRWSQLPHM